MGIAERKEREKQQRRKEILRAAEKVFHQKGFDRATMDDIADMAELSKGTLYLYFNSKENLHMAVARKAIHQLSGLTSEAVAQGGEVMELLLRMGQVCVRYADSNPDQMKAIMTLEGLEADELNMSDQEVQEMIYQESTVGTVLQVIERGVREGVIRSDMPSLLIANTLWMSVLSVIRFVNAKLSLLEALGLTPTQVYESHFELVMNGIRS
jgi:AcrR family transcriptional regulator